MTLFLQAYFWIYLVMCFFKMVQIAMRTYPHDEPKRTLGMDLMCLLETMVFVVWAGVLLWGGR